MEPGSDVERPKAILGGSDSTRKKIFKAGRHIGRKMVRKLGIRSYVRADGFWWYRWHSDVGIGLSDSWERQISHEILRPGGCFVDAGSHVGRWTIRASPFYRRLLAFEPDPFTNKVLRRNLARNNIKNVRVFEIALSNHRGYSPLFSFGPHACNSLRDVHVSGHRRNPGMTVRVRPLDDFTDYFETPMVLKIDVEGEELGVLRGGLATLENFHPIIIVEVHFRNEKMKIVEEMDALGYEIKEEFFDESDPHGIVFLVAKYRTQ